MIIEISFVYFALLIVEIECELSYFTLTFCFSDVFKWDGLN